MNNYYITTPIYYVNDKPHIGHAYTTIACDIFARFQKLQNKNVFFLTGTDEHGQKVEKAAISVDEEPQSFVNKMSNNFRNMVPFLGCEVNDFICTTENRHKIAAQYLWNTLEKNNQIYLSHYEGWYSVRDEAFYMENELIKDNGTFIAPSGAPVEWVKEESYFFKLSQWKDKLIDFYISNPDSIKPKSRYNEVLSFIRGGLRDLSISRTTFKWGIPVPNNNKHVMYVWIDALCNYLTSIGYPEEQSEKFKNFWPGIHIVGKDILRFHSVYWPAFLMAANLKPPKKVFAHGWWTNEGKKISKSLGNVIDPYEVISQYGLDQIRFFLFREVPFGNDGDFSRESIAKRVNADLSNNFGNLIQRICSLIKKNCNNIVENNFSLNYADERLLQFSLEKMNNYKFYMENQEIDKALKETFELLTETNVYVDQQAPWILSKSNIPRMNVVLSLTVELIKRSTLMLYPVIPGSCLKVFDILNLNFSTVNFDNIENLPSFSFSINEPSPVFPRIEIND
jgi:methionyl-tRNA synthetase